MDYDYIDQLSEEEKDWLNRFTEESLNANFLHKGDKHIDDPDYKRKIYGENNARNRCIFSHQRAQGRLYALDDTFLNELNKDNVTKNELEDAFIDYIDNKDDED